jgi:hypothetical protein
MPPHWRKPVLIWFPRILLETYLVPVSLVMCLLWSQVVRWSGLIGSVELTRGQLVFLRSDLRIIFGGGNHVVQVMPMNILQCLEKPR